MEFDLRWKLAVMNQVVRGSCVGYRMDLLRAIILSINMIPGVYHAPNQSLLFDIIAAREGIGIWAPCALGRAK